MDLLIDGQSECSGRGRFRSRLETSYASHKAKTTRMILSESWNLATFVDGVGFHEQGRDFAQGGGRGEEE